MRRVFIIEDKEIIKKIDKMIRTKEQERCERFKCRFDNDYEDDDDSYTSYCGGSSCGITISCGYDAYAEYARSACGLSSLSMSRCD